MTYRCLMLPLIVAALATGPAGAQVPGKAPSAQYMIKVTPHESDRRVDITVDGKPFTSYIWPKSLKKPVLYPITSDNGTVVTRGFPLEPQFAALGRVRAEDHSSRFGTTRTQ